MTKSTNDLLCKGVHIVQAQKWIDARLGQDACKGIAKDVVDPSHRGLWQFILPSSKYQLADLFNVLQEASKRTRVPVETMTTEIAAANAENDLKTVYRAFLRIAKPVRVLAFMPEIWRSYFLFGEISVKNNVSGRFEMECAGVPPDYRDWIVGGWKGFLPVTIRVAGGSDPRCEVLSEPSGSAQQQGLSVRILATYRDA